MIPGLSGPDHAVVPVRRRVRLRPPEQLQPTLETSWQGLYFAGNSTAPGYEEAGAQDC